MNDLNSAPGGGADDRTTPCSRTEPYGLDPDAGIPRPAGWQPNLGQAQARPRGYGRVTRWVAGLSIAAVLVAGGSVLGARLTSEGAAATSASTMLTSNSSAATADQAALSAVLGAPATAGSLSATALSGSPAGRSHLAHAIAALRRCFAAARRLRANGHRAAARARLHACLRGYRVLRLLVLGGIHGQVTFKTKQGVKTVAFERGVIQTDSGMSMVVKASDGTTWTWDLISKTVLVRARQRVQASALAVGERVFVVGPVVSGANDARLIVIHR